MAGSLPEMEEKGRSHGRLGVRLTLKPRDLMEDVAVKGAFTVKVITLFPEAFPGTLGLSLTGKALDMGLWRLEPVGLRPFGEGKHRNVDDTPAGGGAGMVLRPDVMERAIEAAQGVGPLVFLTPRGKPFTQETARRYAQGEGMTLICGRFEGLDQRVIEHYGIEEVSMGDFVLTGGEIPAMALIDATVRLLPRVIGNRESTVEESFSDGLLEHPQYTRPVVWQGREVPEVLQGGNHAAIAKWREAQSHRLTAERRPDLWAAWTARHAKAPRGPALRRAVRELVAGIAPFDAMEADDRARALAWIDGGAEIAPAGRGAGPRLGVRYLQEGPEGLLLAVDGAETILAPGGVVEPGEHPADAIRRLHRVQLRDLARFADEAPVLISWEEGPVLWYLLSANHRGVPDHDPATFKRMFSCQGQDLPQNTAFNIQRFAAKLRK